MSLEYGVYLMFYEGISDRQRLFKSIMDLGKLALVPGANIEHVSLCLMNDEEELMYHVGKDLKAGWRRSKWFHNKYLPDRAIYFGRVTVTKEWMESCPSIVFNLINFVKILLWYFVTRWFSNWKPKDNCCMMSCQLLRELGFPVNDQVVPSILWKDLTDANDTNNWSSWRWEDNACETNS